MKTIISRSQILYAVLLLFCCLLPGLPNPAAAQSAGENGPGSTVKLPENLTRAEVRELIARLSDDQVRELVIAQLDKQAVGDESVSDASLYFARLRAGLDRARDALQRSLDTSGRPLQTLAADIWRQVTVDGSIGAGQLLLQLLVLIAAGWAASQLARRLLLRASSTVADRLSAGQKFDLACYGAAAGALGIGAFAGGAIVAIEIMTRDLPAAQALWYQLVLLIVVVRLVMLVVEQLLAPKSPRLRLVELDDRAAREAWIWSLLLTLSLALPRRLGLLADELGASDDSRLLLGLTLGSIFLLLAIALILRLRSHGTRLIAGNEGEAGMLRLGLGRVWWLLAIIYLLAVWFMAFGKRAATGESSLLPGLGSLFVVAAIPYLDRGLKWLIACYFEERGESHTPAAEADIIADAGVDEAPGAKTPNYHAVALRYGRVLMVLAILTIFVRLWDINVAAISAQLVGERFASASFDIGITVLLTWSLWGVIRIAIERKIAEDQEPGGNADDAEAGGVGGTRIGTVLPLIRAFIQITLIVMAVLISLSALGVNIGPLIAGAGVIGLAIGFGAQTLVRDIVSGLFYLIDDAFRVGEYVVIDQIRGTVEKISIRSFQLRHHNGPVHTIPYGEIRTLTNWSRDWAIMKFELRIPFETDIEKVRKIIKKIGQDLMEDEAFGPLLLAPLKSQGVNRMDDSALIIRCKFTAVPGQQYLIRREAFTRIQRAFEEQGIHFAPRRVLVEATTPKGAIEAAAAAIDREGEGQNKPAADEP